MEAVFDLSTAISTLDRGLYSMGNGSGFHEASYLRPDAIYASPSGPLLSIAGLATLTKGSLLLQPRIEGTSQRIQHNTRER